LSGCESLGKQLLIGEEHDGSGDPELFRQVAGGGKLVAAPKISRQNPFAQVRVHLPEQRPAPFRKWYCQLHKKWLFKNTTLQAMLASESLLTGMEHEGDESATDG
jgi:hypothetical protein